MLHGEVWNILELDIFAWQKISRKLDKNEEICRV